MLLQESRRAARSLEGDLVLLDAQDRTLWNRALIAEGIALVERALGVAPLRTATVQAAIAAVHAEAVTADADGLGADRRALRRAAPQRRPSPVVELNSRRGASRCAMGRAKELALIDAILARGDLQDYQFAHSARADCCRRLGRVDDARAAYARALELARQEPERRFLEKRLRSLSPA